MHADELQPEGRYKIKFNWGEGTGVYLGQYSGLFRFHIKDYEEQPGRPEIDFSEDDVYWKVQKAIETKAQELRRISEHAVNNKATSISEEHDIAHIMEYCEVDNKTALKAHQNALFKIGKKRVFYEWKLKDAGSEKDQVLLTLQSTFKVDESVALQIYELAEAERQNRRIAKSRRHS